MFRSINLRPYPAYPLSAGQTDLGISSVGLLNFAVFSFFT